MEKGIPRVYYSGVEGEFNVMVMDMLGNFIWAVNYSLGSSLENLFE